MPRPTGRATPERAESNAAAGTAAGARWTPWHFVLLAMAGVLLAVHRAEAPPDTDIFWSARYGIDLTSMRSIPRSDSYSWTASGRTWIPSSWGWNVVLGIAHRAGGTAGFWIVGILLAAALAVVIGFAARRIDASPLPTVGAFAALGVLGLVVLPRAQATGYLVLFALPPLVRTIVFGPTRRALRAIVILAGLQVVWMNLHSSALLGPFLVLVGGLALIAKVRPSNVGMTMLRLGVAAVVAFAACFATPYGWAPVRHADDVRKASVGLISEWDHAGFGNFAQVIGVLAVVVGVCFAFVAWRGDRAETAGMLIVIAAASADVVRFAPMLFVFVIPEVAVAIGRLDVRPMIYRRAVALVMIALATFATISLPKFAELSDRSASPRLVDELPRSCRLVNDYSIGAAVILNRPDVRVSIDGRNDMYGRAQVLGNQDVLRDDIDARSYVDQHAVTCVLAYTGYKIIDVLSHTQGWVVVDHDTQRTLLARR